MDRSIEGNGKLRTFGINEPKTYSIKIFNSSCKTLRPGSVEVLHNYKLVSFDVSLVTHDSLDSIIEALKKYWEHINSAISLSRNEFIDGICFLFSSTYL